MNTERRHNWHGIEDHFEHQMCRLQRTSKDALAKKGLVWTFGGKLLLNEQLIGEVYADDYEPKLIFNSLIIEESKRDAIRNAFNLAIYETPVKENVECDDLALAVRIVFDEVRDAVGRAVGWVKKAAKVAGQILPDFGDFGGAEPELEPVRISDDERAVAEGE
jgi:hypothetical protein